MEQIRDDDFVCYANPNIKQTKLEDMKGKYVSVVLSNGFSYQGILLIVYNDNIVFMDRKQGEKKIGRDKIFVCFESAASRRRDIK